VSCSEGAEVLFCHTFAQNPHVIVLYIPVLAYRYAFFLALIVISYLAFAQLPESPIKVWDKLLHGTAFCCLLFLADRGFIDKHALIHPLKIIGLFFYGMWIESMQNMIPYREASLLDLMANLFGMLTYISIKYLFIQKRLYDKH